MPKKKIDAVVEAGDAILEAAPEEKLVRVTITKFGDGKVSTGVHVAGKGDVMARRGEIIATTPQAAEAMEAQGLVETVE